MAIVVARSSGNPYAPVLMAGKAIVLRPPGGIVNGPVHAPAAQQAGVGGVHDRVSGKVGRSLSDRPTEFKEDS